MYENEVQDKAKMTKKMSEEEEKEEMGIEQLPEGCISHILSFTSPADACRAAAVSTTFCSAVESDIVWDKFIPPDYPQIVADSTTTPIHHMSKKDLYLYLSDHPILINNGKMSFQVDRSSGGKCYMLSARALTIIWGSSPQYWEWIQLPNSRFGEVAKLLNVCWLEIRGKIESNLLTKKMNYVAYLIFRLDNYNYGLKNPPQRACVKLGNLSSELIVQVKPTCLFAQVGDPAVKLPQARDDRWLEVELGEFYNDTGEDGEVDASLMETEGGQWKRGLIVQGIEIRPKRSNLRD